MIPNENFINLTLGYDDHSDHGGCDDHADYDDHDDHDYHGGHESHLDLFGPLKPFHRLTISP